MPTPSPVPTIISNMETPRSADAFVNTIGINGDAANLYGESDFTTLVSLEKQLGVRNFRETILPGTSGYNAAINQLLNSTGAKIDGLSACANLSSSPTTSSADIQQFDSAIGNRLESVEGPNEVDASGDSNWPADTKTCMQSLRGAEPGIPFVAASLSDPNDNASTFGNISSLVDEGNAHRYYSGRNPGTGGYGGTGSCGTYGALSWALCLTEINSGNKPIVITETGYNSQTEVDEATQAKYLSRMFFVDQSAGVAASFIYKLKDDANGAYFGGDGLLRNDDSQKPSYTMLKNLIGNFSDAGGSPPLTPLAYNLSNSNLSHALYQKRDGSYLLAVWNEAVSWNVSTGTETSVPAQSETIGLEEPPSSLSAYAFDDEGNLDQRTTTVSGAAITLSVDDHVTLVHFHL